VAHGDEHLHRSFQFLHPRELVLIAFREEEHRWFGAFRRKTLTENVASLRDGEG
jgi:hypothetical protein